MHVDTSNAVYPLTSMFGKIDTQCETPQLPIDSNPGNQLHCRAAT